MVQICVRYYQPTAGNFANFTQNLETLHHFLCRILYQILNNFSRSDDPSSPLDP